MLAGSLNAHSLEERDESKYCTHQTKKRSYTGYDFQHDNAALKLGHFSSGTGLDELDVFFPWQMQMIDGATQ